MAVVKIALVMIAALAGFFLVLLSALMIWMIVSQIIDHSDKEGTNIFYVPVLLLIAAGGLTLVRPAIRRMARGVR